MRTKVYKCDLCGFWARKELKFLVGKKAICHNCGREMRVGYKDVKPLPDVRTQQLIALKAAKIKDYKEKKQERTANSIWTENTARRPKIRKIL